MIQTSSDIPRSKHGTTRGHSLPCSSKTFQAFQAFQALLYVAPTCDACVTKGGDGMRREHTHKRQFERSSHGDPAHGKALPRVRSVATYALPGAALLLALSVVGLAVNGALGGN